MSESLQMQNSEYCLRLIVNPPKRTCFYELNAGLPIKEKAKNKDVIQIQIAGLYHLVLDEFLGMKLQ